jgi:hypothetical protein
MGTPHLLLSTCLTAHCPVSLHQANSQPGTQPGSQAAAAAAAATAATKQDAFDLAGMSRCHHKQKTLFANAVPSSVVAAFATIVVGFNTDTRHHQLRH